MIRTLVLVAAALSLGAGLVACSDDKPADMPKPETVKAAVDALPPPPPKVEVPGPTPVSAAAFEAAAAPPPPPNPPPPPAPKPAEKGSGW